MKVKKTIKDNLLKLVQQMVVTGTPDTAEFSKAIEEYKELKEFVESLEIEEKKLEEEKI